MRRTVQFDANVALDAKKVDNIATYAVLPGYLRHLHAGRVDPRAIGFRMTVPSDDHQFTTLLSEALARQPYPGLPENVRFSNVPG